jgi:hypothetical protein
VLEADPMTGLFEAGPQEVRVVVDVSGLPAVMALAKACRDLIDHAEDGPNRRDVGGWPLVRPADLRALEDAVAPIYPGAAA